MPTSWRVAMTSQSRSVVNVPHLSGSSSMVPVRSLSSLLLPFLILVLYVSLLLSSMCLPYLFFIPLLTFQTFLLYLRFLFPCLFFSFSSPTSLLFFMMVITIVVTITIKASSSFPRVLLLHLFSSSLTFFPVGGRKV